MSEISPVNQCPTCGAPWPANAPQGLCPKCLLLGVATPTDSGASAATHRPPPPALAKLAAAFPQLEIWELIGQGGMGCVFKARQPQLNRFVALKILPETLACDPAFADRFTREAQALAALSHPNIVTIHDFGQAGGFFYLLMEYVDGVNLRQALGGGRFTPEQALAIVPPLCDALQFAHERGIVHRDIKPENLLLDRDGRIKIADFGIAKIIREQTPEVGLAESQPAGTPQYMAPEQKSSPRSVDSRADIYSLGMVFYELLTGELPGDPWQPPSARVRGIQIDVRLDEIVLRALAQTPERRYQTVAELRTQVETLAALPPAPPSKTTAPAGPQPGNAAANPALVPPFPWLWVALTVGLHAVFWLLLLVVVNGLVPPMIEILQGFGVALPPLTRFSTHLVLVQEKLVFLFFPLGIGFDLALCVAIQRLGGTHWRRIWSLALMLISLLAAVGLYASVMWPVMTLGRQINQPKEVSTGVTNPEAPPVESAPAAPPPRNGRPFEIRLVLAGSTTESQEVPWQRMPSDPQASPVTETLHLRAQPLLNETDVRSASFGRHAQTGEVEIRIEFTDTGAKRFAEATRLYAGQRLAILLAGQVYSTPLVREPIAGNQCVITGRFTEAEAQQLVQALAPRK